MGDLKKGRDILADQVTTEPGVSDVGIEIRRGDERNKGVISHGYARVTDPKSHKEHAKRYLGALVGALKAQPKPNLPKSEVEKADDQEKGVHKPHFMAGKKTGVSDVGARVMPDVKPSGKTKEYIKDKHKQVLAELTAMPKPKLTKADIEQFDEQLRKDNLSERIKQLRADKEAARQKQLEEHFKAKGQSVPEHLKGPQQPQTLDYKQLRTEFQQKNSPLAEMKAKAKAAKLNPPPPPLPQERYRKIHQPDISGKVDYKQPKLKVAKADVKIQPAQVSEPIIRNRTTYSEPLKISGPNVINPMRDNQMKKCGAALKKMIGCLKKVDPKTRLPGILLDKKAK